MTTWSDVMEQLVLSLYKQLAAECARSAALMAENERMQKLSGELVSRFETVLDHCARYTDVREGRERLREFRAALAQPAPTSVSDALINAARGRNDSGANE